jgi:hypothetical protein
MSTANDHVQPLVDDYLHDLLSPAETARVEAHCAACAVCQTTLDEARQRRAALMSLPPREASPQLLDSTLQRIEQYKRRPRRALRNYLISSLAGLAAAALVLLGMQVYYSSLAATSADLIVLGQHQLIAAAPGSLRILLVDRKTNLPMAGVPVTVELHRRGEVQELTNSKTDAHGAVEPRFTLPDWEDRDCQLHVRARAPSGEEHVTQQIELHRSWKLMLTSDKPVYQPGQTIQARALALRRPDLHAVAGQTAVFTLNDPKGNVLFKEEVKTSAFGIASTECLLDQEIAEGAYTLFCKLGNTESQLALEVRKYVLPKFKLDVRPDRPFYQPGQDVRLTVDAAYFFGKPVAKGDVQVEVFGTDPTGKPLQVLVARTDPSGQATLTSKLPNMLPGREDEHGDAHVTFRVTVTDTAGQKQVRSTSRIVTARPVHIEVIPEGKTLVRGMSNRVYFFVMAADGTPLQARLTIDGRQETLQTDKQGLADLDFTPETFRAQWKVTATGKDGKFLAQSTVLLECGEAAGDFLLRTDHAVYNAGSTLKLTALGGGREPVFVDFLKDGQTLLTRTIDMDGGTGDLTFDLPPELSGTVQVCGYRFDVKGHPLRRSRVLHVRPTGELKIKTTVDANEYRPRGTAVVHFEVTDAAGKPTPSALSLSAVDEAVFSVLSQHPGLERALFTLEQKLLEPVYTIYPWSPEVRDDRLEQAVFAAAAAADQVENIKGAGPTNTAAVHSLTAETFTRKAEAVDRERRDGLDTVRRAILLVCGAAFLLLYIGLWFVVRPLIMIVATYTLVLIGVAIKGSVGHRDDLAFETVAAQVGRAQTEAVQQGGLDVVDASGSLKNDSFLPPAKSAVQRESGSGKPRIRSYFPETLLWRPEVITDDHGRARVEVPLADSITTWRLSASAVTSDGRLGASESPIKVFQPFFADLDLPVALTRGDEVSVPVVVHNYLRKPQTVTLTLTKAPWFQALGDARQTIEVPPGEARSVHFPLHVEKVGEQELTVIAVGEGVSDALKRRIEVVPDGHRIEQAPSGILDRPAEVRLSLPEGVIEGSAKAILKIYPSSFSQLVEGLDNIFQMPHGCFEQTSSTTYPNVLALDYLRRTKRSAPEVEMKARQYIHLGYQRLVGFEVSGGGFDWFGRPPAHLTLTAYGLMEFEDMARVHDVDPQLIDRTRRWLLQQRQADGSWQERGAGLHDDLTHGVLGEMSRLGTTAYVAWAVFAQGSASEGAGKTRDYLVKYRPEAITDTNVLALVCNALLAMDPSRTAAAPYCDRLVALQQTSKEDARQVWWGAAPEPRTTFYGSGRSAQVETTALATLALVQSKRHPGVVKGALGWLMAQKDSHGTWYSTQATVLSLKALLAATGAALGDADREIEVRLGERVIEKLTIPAAQAEVLRQVDLTPHLAIGDNAVTITDLRNRGTGYQLAFRYHLPGPAPAAPPGPLTISLDYDRTELRVNETLQATVKAASHMRLPSAMVMLDLPIPPGFAPVTEDFTALVRSGVIARFQVPPRQVLVYLRGLDPAQPVSFTYHLRATMPVKAAVAGARVYEYYDPQKQARSNEARLTVKDEK